MYEPVIITLTKSQIKQALQGKPIKINKENMGGSLHTVLMHPMNAYKVKKCKEKCKGGRIHLTPHEIMASGEGLGDIWNWIKNAGSWIKNNIIDSPVYQAVAKPIVRGLVDTGTTLLGTKIGPGAAFVKTAVDEIGKQTGAFGIKEKKSKKSKNISESDEADYLDDNEAKKQNKSKKRVQLSHNMSSLISPMHPSFSPYSSLLPPISGGSFLPA